MQVRLSAPNLLPRKAKGFPLLSLTHSVQQANTRKYTYICTHYFYTGDCKAFDYVK